MRHFSDHWVNDVKFVCYFNYLTLGSNTTLKHILSKKMTRNILLE